MKNKKPTFTKEKTNEISLRKKDNVSLDNLKLMFIALYHAIRQDNYYDGVFYLQDTFKKIK